MIEKRFIHTFGQEWPRAIGPALTIAPNGDWLCHWVAGPSGDLGDGQDGLSAVYKRSTDAGQTWGNLQVWISPDGPDRCGHGHPNYIDGGDIVAFGLCFDAGRGGMTRRRPFITRSQDSGHTWSPHQPLHERAGIVTRRGRIVLRDGTWLFPQHYVRPPDLPWDILRFPTELREQRDYSTWIRGVNVLASRDQGRTFEPWGAIEPPGPVRMNEPHVVELRDGTVAMLIRADKDGWLWRSDSNDGGRTWSAPCRTEIPNPASKVSLLRLEDGRIALVHNPNSAARDPLALWISDDELATWPVQLELDSWAQHAAWFTAREGAGTSTALAYPHAMQVGRQLHVAYDLGRRDIVHIVVDLDAL